MSPLPPDVFVGAFYFEPADHGIIYGTYLNNESPFPYPEAAIILNADSQDRFAGKYRTVWLERMKSGTTQKVSGHLEIKQNGTKPGVYDLFWTSINPGSGGYTGLGMLQKGNLVGTYWKA